MTMPNEPADAPTPMTFAEIRALLEQTAKAAAENTQAIAEMRAGIAENTQAIAEMRAGIAEIHSAQRRTEKLVAENTQAIAEMRAGIAELTQAQHRTNQDVSTLKGWGLELYCERNPEIFAETLGLFREQLIPKREIRRIADEAESAGVITPDQFRNLCRADVFIYARRKSDNLPFCLVVEASFRVGDEDVNRAADRAEILGIILQKYQPRHLNGQVIPIVAGTDIEYATWFRAKNYGVTYINVQNGDQLTNPPE